MRALAVGDTFLFRGLDGQTVPVIGLEVLSVGVTGTVVVATTIDGEPAGDALAQLADVVQMIKSEVWLYN